MTSPEYIRRKVRYPSGADVDRPTTKIVTTTRPTTASGCRVCRGYGRSIPGELSSIGRCSLRSLSAIARSFQTTIQLNSPGMAPAPQRAPRLRSARSPRYAEGSCAPTTIDVQVLSRRYLNHFCSVAFSGMCDRNYVERSGAFYLVPPIPMTQLISSLLHLNGHQHTVAIVKSDRLLLQVLKTPWTRRMPPYVLTLDLQASQNSAWIRVVEIHGDTPQVCAALVTQLLTIARQGLANSHSSVPSANG